MSCEDCANAAAKVWGGFTFGCKGCCARALSRGPDFSRVRSNGQTDRIYRNALQQFGLTHEQVKAASAADFEGRDRTAPSKRTHPHSLVAGEGAS